MEIGCETADHVWLSRPPRSETHLNLINIDARAHTHTHTNNYELENQARESGMKGKYDKNALVMGFNSLKTIPIKCFTTDDNEYRREKDKEMPVN